MNRIVAKLAVLALFAVLAVLVWRYGPPVPTAGQGDCWSSVALFVLAYAAATLLPVPKAVFSLAGGAIFGVPLGLAATLTGATLGAAIAFGMARVLGRDLVERYGGQRIDRLDTMFVRHGVLAVIGLRLVPVVPFTAMNYTAGLTSLRWSAYVGGTIVGIAPGAMVYTVLGAYGRDPGSWPFLTALTCLAVLTVSALVLARRHRRRDGDAPAARPQASE